MANREALPIIRAARAGKAAAQLALGKYYLFGAAGLPRNPASALYWLDRAAQQQERDAWVLIGSYIPFETAVHATQLNTLCFWYARAFDAGVIEAGLVLAKLVLARPQLLQEEALRCKAVQALKAAAQAGIPDAQWLFAQLLVKKNVPEFGIEEDPEAWHQWTERAAQGGVAAAQQLLTEQAWERQDYPSFLKWALPAARSLVQRAGADPSSLKAAEALQLKRCAIAMQNLAGQPLEEIRQLWQLAAEAGDREAQFLFGLLLAKIDSAGKRVVSIPGAAYYKKAIRWLAMAGEQGVAQAWYAISKIYSRPEFSGRNLQEARRYLQQAAQAGDAAAQLEWGLFLWHGRKEDAASDVQAVYWLQKAVAQGSGLAKWWLDRIAPQGMPAAWAAAARQRMSREQLAAFPFLAARLELAACFGLSRAEALLLNLPGADCGHCLVIDIRQLHPRSKRRLIRIEKGEERQLLDRLLRLFEDVDCSFDGPEGNYRRRLYRLKSLALE